MNDEFVERFNSNIVNQGTAILKVKYYNPPELIFQHPPVEERLNIIEGIGMGNVFIIETVTSFDIKGIIRVGGRIIELCEGVIHRERLKVNPFKRVSEKFFNLAKNFKDQGDEVMELLLEFLRSSLYGEQKQV